MHAALSQHPSARVSDILIRRDAAFGAGWSADGGARVRQRRAAGGEVCGSSDDGTSASGGSDDSTEDLLGAGKTGGLGHVATMATGEPPLIPVDGYGPDGDPRGRAAITAVPDRSPSPSRRPLIVAMRSPERRARGGGFVPAGAKPLAPPLGSLAAVEALRRSG